MAANEQKNFADMQAAELNALLGSLKTGMDELKASQASMRAELDKAKAELEQNYLTLREPQRREEAARAWNDWQDRCDEEAEHGEDYVVPKAPDSTVDELAYILAPTLHRF